MPSECTFETLASPNNPAVTLSEVAARNYAIIRFSGFFGEDKTARKSDDLLAWLKTKGIAPIGNSEFARYNPPWILPFLRRNEIMVEY